MFRRMLGIHTVLASFLSRERRIKQIFRESPENQGKGTLLYSITSTTVFGWGLQARMLGGSGGSSEPSRFDPRSGGPRLIIVVRSLVYALRVHVRKDPGALRFT